MATNFLRYGAKVLKSKSDALFVFKIEKSFSNIIGEKKMEEKKITDIFFSSIFFS